ncbi:MAG: hypothetical protein ACE5FD_09305 [Anaerolineae bacterium]
MARCLDGAVGGSMGKTVQGKEKAQQFNEDAEIQALLAEINADDGAMSPFTGQYTAEKAAPLRAHIFDRAALDHRGQPYERLDQLVVELLPGTR